MNSCAACIHWELKGSPMRVYGMGTCAKEVGIFRKARTFGAAAPCGKEQFRQADAATVAAREKALARLEKPAA